MGIQLSFIRDCVKHRLYALWVFMPFGYLCPLGIYALWVFMPFGYLCPLGIYALWVFMR